MNNEQEETYKVLVKEFQRSLTAIMGKAHYAASMLDRIGEFSPAKREQGYNQLKHIIASAYEQAIRDEELDRKPETPSILQ